MDIDTMISPERLKADVQHLREWITKEPHLPKIDDEEWLATVLYHNKFSLEKSKHKLNGYYSLRSKYPEVLKNRDPLAPEIVKAGIAFKVTLASRLTKNDERVLFAQVHPDPSIFNTNDVLKRLFMILDLAFVENYRNPYYVAVADCRYLSYQHFLKSSSMIRVGAEIFLNAFSERSKAVHIVNAPSFISMLLDCVMRFMPEKYASKVFVHSSTENLKKIIDEDVLCSDFGGRGPTLAENDEFTRKTLEKHRMWFLEQDDVCSNELLRRSDGKHLDDMKGSFRKLDID